MKLRSKYFDSIRVKPEQDRTLREKTVTCEWPDCEEPGPHPAPKGRDNENEYHYFCLKHVREYNKGYNYFTGMKEDAVKEYISSSRTGHRPTWKLGQNSPAGKNRNKSRTASNPQINDPFGFIGKGGKGEQHARPRRSVRNAELKALYELGLDETATPQTVKIQYKKLIKRLHPDANKGSRANEDKLQKVLKAHIYLKSSGFLRK